MMSPIQKQGYLGDITSKSTAELMDLASRQEKILRKTIFVESLPDKGAKVRAFYEKLQQLLLARNQQVDGISPQTKDASQLKSECAPAAVLGDKQEQAIHDSSLQNETQQNITTIGTRNISSSEDEIRLQENKRKSSSPTLNSFQDNAITS
ncbi:DNA-directed RNA polymerase II subunit GRINL1A-like [Pecten maximus]|uniref:DNA-directed RNA polymerase II subunit GRINL1A-like n=1 Tax=Pecten maximus TaxID=6579 RepID=UPI001458CE46|nr:DNA-directed RNA polymerase II subunit GRINL1A-like [Pecten maximus]